MKRGKMACAWCESVHPMPPFHVLADEVVLCGDCCDRIVAILRGMVLEGMEDGGPERA